MRISDWSSDVCSSDLLDRVERINRLVGERSGLDAGRDEIDWAGIDALRIGDADRIIGRRCTVGEALHIALRPIIIFLGDRRADDEGVVPPAGVEHRPQVGARKRVGVGKSENESVYPDGIQFLQKKKK